MKAWISSIAVVVLFTVSAIAITAQSEAGGGGRAEQRSTGVVDTTFKSRPRPTVKRTAPKRTAPKKTAAEYEADGDNYYDQKDYDSALVAYENAVRLKPSYKSLYRVGWIYNDFSEYAKALAALDRATALDESQYTAYTEKGYALRRLGRTDEAIIALKTSISLNSENYIAPYELGSIYNEKKMYPEAERYVTQSITDNGD